MSKIQAIINPVTPFEQNAPIIFCMESMKCAFVDPGGDIDKLLNLAMDKKLIPEKILLTHGHLDHAGAATELSDLLKIKIIGPHKDDDFLLNSLTDHGKMFGMDAKNCTPDQWLNDGDVVSVGNCKFNVLHCPGHTPGHIVFFNEDSKLAIVGDVIFKGSIGRTDFPKGNFNDLISSITNKLWPLGNDIEFISGHGPKSTFGNERDTNMFVSDSILSS